MCWDDTSLEASGQDALAEERFRFLPSNGSDTAPVATNWRVDAALAGVSTTMRCTDGSFCTDAVEMYKAPLQLHSANPFGLTVVGRHPNQTVEEVEWLRVDAQLQLSHVHQANPNTTRWVSSIPLQQELHQCGLKVSNPWWIVPTVCNTPHSATAATLPSPRGWRTKATRATSTPPIPLAVTFCTTVAMSNRAREGLHTLDVLNFSRRTEIHPPVAREW